MTRLNKYDWGLILLIACHVFGGIGNAFTIPRILSIILLPYTLKSLMNYGRLLPNYIKIFFIIWFTLSILSFIWTPNLVNGLKFVAYNICSVALFIDLFYFSKKATAPIRSILYGWCLLFLLTLPIALNEFINNIHLASSQSFESSTLIDDTGNHIYRKFAGVTFGNINAYSLVCSYVLPFLTAAILYIKKRNLLFWGLYIGIIYVILMNASRGALLCLVITSLLFIFYAYRQKSISKFHITFISVCIVFFIIQYADLFFQQIGMRLISASLTEDNARLAIYTVALKILLSSVFMGCGIGGLELAFKQTGENVIAATHNFFMEVLVQYGIISFIVFIVCLWEIYRKLYSSGILVKRYLAQSVLFTIIPLSVINSIYLDDTLFWMFLSSLLSIGYVNR